MKRIILSAVAGLITGLAAHAVQAFPEPVTVTQPDGTTITLRIHGDEEMDYTTTTDGYTVVMNQDGYYVYALLEEGSLVPTQVVARNAAERSLDEVSFLSGVQRGLHPERVEQAEVSATTSRSSVKDISTPPPLSGYNKMDFSEVKGLMILVNYSDKTFISGDDANALYNEMVNTASYTGGTYSAKYVSSSISITGSVLDYYSDNSGENFKPTFNVVGPVKIDYAASDARPDGSTNKDIFVAALEAADDLVDFSQYDSDGDGVVDYVFFLVAGNGSNYTGSSTGYLWPHRSSLSSVTPTLDGKTFQNYACSIELYGTTSNVVDGIGTIVHEFNHVLGLPDLYDTNDDTDGESLDPQYWSVMATGNYLNCGYTPAGLSIYERYALGWATPTEIDSEGSYSLTGVQSGGSGYYINASVDDEFFVIENRQKTGWDASLPGSGMLVWRVDLTSTYPWTSNKVNCNTDHNYYELVRACGAATTDTHTDGDCDAFGNSVYELKNSDSNPTIKSWTGIDTPYELSSISISDGTVSFTASAVTVTGIGVTGLSGTGTASDPYLIKTVSDWNTLSGLVDGGKDFSGCYVEITADLDFSTGTSIKALGASRSTYFNGYLDGGKHTINIGSLTADAAYFGGLFTKTGDNAYIHDLTVTGSISSSYSYTGGVFGTMTCKAYNITSEVNVTATTYYSGGVAGQASGGAVLNGCTYSGTLSSSSYRVGGIAGTCTSATFTSCTNSGTVSSSYSPSSSSYPTCLGGIAGYVYTSVLAGCTNSGTVKATGTASSYGYVGGIAGYVYGSTSAANSITGCENTSTVSSTQGNCGGIAGLAGYTTISDCSNDDEGSVSTTYYYTGGIVGYLHNGGTITGCENTGTTYSSYPYLGGIAGLTYGYGSSTAGAVIENCTNSSEISVKGQYVGGIVGYANTYTTTTGCVNEASITNTYTSKNYTGGIAGYMSTSAALSDCVNNGTVTASSAYAGGIAGYAYTSNTITDCVNNGSVTGTYYIGGVVGVSHYGANTYITDCVNNGTVTASSYYAGGIAGTAYYGDGTSITGCTNNGNVTATAYSGGILGMRFTTSTNGTLTIENCTNSGALTCSAYNGGSYAGGILGYFNNDNAKIQITNCTNTGAISATGNAVGGIVGYVTSGSSYINTVSNCVNYGNVSSTYQDDYSYLGGIVGEAYYTSISGCSNHGDVTYEWTEDNSYGGYNGGIVGCLWQYSTVASCYNTGNVKGYRGVGGVVGLTTSAGSTTSSVSRCFNVGDVDGYVSVGGVIGEGYLESFSDMYSMGAISGNNRVGGIIGLVDASAVASKITNAYFAGTITASSEAGYIVGSNDNSSTTAFSSSNQLENTYYLEANATLDEGALTTTATDEVSVDLSYAELAELDMNTGYTSGSSDDGVSTASDDDDSSTSAWTSTDDYSYPILSDLSDNDYAKAYSAAVIPMDENDNYSAITNNVYLGGSADGTVTWTDDADDETFWIWSSDGETSIGYYPTAGSSTVTVTATCGDVEVATVLNATILTGVETIDGDLPGSGRELVDEEYYTTSGARVAQPSDGAKAIYIVRRVYDDGTVTATKEAR